MSRLEKLQQLLQDDPTDPFLHYGIAIEFLNQGESSTGIKKLRDTIDQFPDYVAAYFRIGQALAEDDQADEARKIVTIGIEVAKKVGNAHAAGEMGEFLQMLG